jgi:hypothetical protein
VRRPLLGGIAASMIFCVRIGATRGTGRILGGYSRQTVNPKVAMSYS